jgi:hypothetical protein
MKRKIALTLMLLATPALGGCALQAAMAAAQLAHYLPETERPSNAHLRPAALEACKQRAAAQGSVFVTDVEQRRADLIIVWGSVVDSQQRRRTFECRFTNALASFRLGEVLPAE